MQKSAAAVLLTSLLFLLARTAVVTTSSARQAAAKTVWSGVYTDAQANRGKEAYVANCLLCHGADLGGGSDPSGDAAGTALVGSNFWNAFGDDSLSGLFGIMRNRMPLDSPGSLDVNVYLDILAFILQSNQLPSGPEALTADGVAAIHVVARDGRPQPVKDFTLVRAVGCLAQPARGKWSLTSSTDPVRTRDPKSPELFAVGAVSLGTKTLELEDVYTDPSAYIGHTVEVRGFLIAQPAGDRVNITSLRTIAPTCGK